MNSEELREAGNPYWVDVLTAGEFLGLADKTVLHSGPPIEYARMCPLHKRCMVNACYMEGWAKSESEAYWTEVTRKVDAYMANYQDLRKLLNLTAPNGN